MRNLRQFLACVESDTQKMPPDVVVEEPCNHRPPAENSLGTKLGTETNDSLLLP